MLFVRLWFLEEPKVEVHENNESSLKDISVLRGKHLSNDKYCIGSDVGGEHEPHGIKLEKGHICEECIGRDGFYSCAICNGSRCLNPKAWKWCNQPFVVYLAYFGGKEVKVGVTARKRVEERLKEQGAIAYRIHKNVENGMKARQVESRMQFKDRMRNSRKAKLYKKIDLDWFEKEHGPIEVIDKNFEVTNKITRQKLLRNVNYIPDEEFSLIGKLLVFKKHIVSFNSIRGRKTVNRKNLFDF